MTPSQLPARPKVDLGLALQGMTSDPDWMKSCGTMGLLLLVPIVGPLVMFGWLRRIYDAARAGDFHSLPPPEPGPDMSRGLPVIAAMFNLALPVMVLGFGVWFLALLMSLFGAALQDLVGGSDLIALAMGLVGGLVWLCMMVVILAVNVLMPEVQRRGMNGEMLPLLQPRASIRALARDPGAYVTVLIGLFLANLVGSLGVFACYVGMFFTIPLSLTVVARLLAQWDAVVRHRELEAG